MINKVKLNEYIEKYKNNFSENIWPTEQYKWIAVKHFQDNWDINADDFASMLDESLNKTGNLLASFNNFPRRMIVQFAKNEPQIVKSMFADLFNEDKDLYQRINNFKNKSDELLKKSDGKAAHHFQDENTISIYLWLKYPDKYYIYKMSCIKSAAKILECGYVFKNGRYEDNISNYMLMYNEICEEVKKHSELKELLNSQMTVDCYKDENLHTLVIDLVFYIYIQNQNISEINEETTVPPVDNRNKRYWFLNANPKMWSMSSMPVNAEQDYTLYNDDGHKRRIFSNFLDAKKGDMVIGYESTPVKKIVAIAQVSAENDGERIYFKKIEGLASPIDYADLKANEELQNMEYMRGGQGSLFKLTEDEYDSIINMIREANPVKNPVCLDKYSKSNFLDDVYMSSDKYDHLVNVLKKKKNIILQGAPGVGKTYAAKRLAYSIMGEQDKTRVKLIQFHQNYSYEDFMMGYKPVDNGFKLQNGIFYQFCNEADNHPDKDYFFIIDEINRGNMSKIFGELLMAIENDYRGNPVTLAYTGMDFCVPENLFIIGMMNTADRSLAMIDYALRRRFSFFDMEPGFDSDGFKKYQQSFANKTFDSLIEKIQELNKVITEDNSLGKGFCIGHSYFCNIKICNDETLKDIVDYDILPMLSEYWFDNETELDKWKNELSGVFKND